MVTLVCSYGAMAQGIDKAVIDSLIIGHSNSEERVQWRLLDSLSQKLYSQKENNIELFEYFRTKYEKDSPYYLEVTAILARELNSRGNTEEALQMRLDALELARQNNLIREEVSFGADLASSYLSKKETDKALKYVNQALEKAVELKKPWAAQSILYERKRWVYFKLGDSIKVREYAIRSWDAIKDHPEAKRYGFALYTITDFYKSNKEYENLAASLELLGQYVANRKREIPDYHMPIDYIFKSGDYETMIPTLERVIEISYKSSKLNSLTQATLSLAKLYEVNNEYDKALPYLEQLEERINSANNKERASEYYLFISQFYSRMGDFEKAYEASSSLRKVQQGIDANRLQDNIAQYEVSFQTAQKEQELTKRKAEQKMLWIGLAAAGIILTLLSFFFIQNRKKNQLLKTQKSQLEKLVDEKNILLRETHHRVKNSFQIVSSLLYLQSEAVQDKQAAMAIKEAQNRVKSMVLIHQKLYSKDELVGINSKEYVNDLVRDIFESHQWKEKELQYQVSADSMILDIETITPMGLILNELITNTLKHAFPEVLDDSEIQIELKRNANAIYLSVQDNGIGLQGKVANTSFGIKLMKALCKKLKATLEYQPAPNGGTIAMVHINRFNLLS